MKKTLLVILSAVLLFCTAACAKNSSAANDAPSNNMSQNNNSNQTPYFAKIFEDSLYYTAPDSSGTWSLYLRNLKTGENKSIYKTDELIISHDITDNLVIATNKKWIKADSPDNVRTAPENTVLVDSMDNCYLFSENKKYKNNFFINEKNEEIIFNLDGYYPTRIIDGKKGIISCYTSKETPNTDKEREEFYKTGYRVAYNVYTKEIVKDISYFHNIDPFTFVGNLIYYHTVNKDMQAEIHVVPKDLSENKILITSPSYNTSLALCSDKYLITREYNKEENTRFYKYYDRKTGKFIKDSNQIFSLNSDETIGFIKTEENNEKFYCIFNPDTEKLIKKVKVPLDFNEEGRLTFNDNYIVFYGNQGISILDINNNKTELITNIK